MIQKEWRKSKKHKTMEFYDSKKKWRQKTTRKVYQTKLTWMTTKLSYSTIRYRSQFR